MFHSALKDVQPVKLPIPLIPGGSLVEQLDEQDPSQGGTSWSKFTWKETVKQNS